MSVMNRKEIIEKLKNNERLFARLSEEERKLLSVISKDYILQFTEYKTGFYFGVKHNDNFCELSVYRLVPDYKEEPEIVECKVIPSYERGQFEFSWIKVVWKLSQAVNLSQFRGYKFSDGTISPIPWAYRDRTCEWEHATHVIMEVEG